MGSFTALVGRQGSGKSAILNGVAGLAKVTSGRVQIGGINLVDLPEHKVVCMRREEFGFVYQDYTPVDSLSGWQLLGLLPMTPNNLCERANWSA